ncbi:Grx4 family monothiol glutaredoxin [Buchnera aphidicola]|uniref:Grx4 family monothiol glutaredoxin n=1 Tax=Buchnera aphidicola TaxID=9 RepID=UPI00346479DE
MDVIKKIKKQIKDNSILIYMKGSPDFPSCGFSAKVVEILSNLNIRFAYVDVLENDDIRSSLPQYSNWPTFPQLWVHGELIGGCDIVVDMFNNGELKKVLGLDK